jgi:hypothetical protein
MGTITCYGLEQENRVAGDLCTTYIDRLKARNITPEKLASGNELVKVMLEKDAATINTETAKELLTGQEKTLREHLGILLQSVLDAVKTKFGKSSKQGKDFHEGEKMKSSTPKTLKWATDTINVFPTYKDALAGQGIVKTDIDAISAAADALASMDTQQEKAKQAAIDATAAADLAQIAVVTFLDSIQTAAGMEFANEPSIKTAFVKAKQLRYEPDPRKPKGGGGTTPPSGGGNAPTPDAPK